MLGRNQKISREDLDFVRSLDDFELIVLISEINDGGWAAAKRLIPQMRAAIEALKQKESTNASNGSSESH